MKTLTLSNSMGSFLINNPTGLREIQWGIDSSKTKKIQKGFLQIIKDNFIFRLITSPVE